MACDRMADGAVVPHPAPMGLSEMRTESVPLEVGMEGMEIEVDGRSVDLADLAGTRRLGSTGQDSMLGETSVGAQVDTVMGQAYLGDRDQTRRPGRASKRPDAGTIKGPRSGPGPNPGPRMPAVSSGALSAGRSASGPLDFPPSAPRTRGGRLGSGPRPGDGAGPASPDNRLMGALGRARAGEGYSPSDNVDPLKRMRIVQGEKKRGKGNDR